MPDSDFPSDEDVKIAAQAIHDYEDGPRTTRNLARAALQAVADTRVTLRPTIEKLSLTVDDVLLVRWPNQSALDSYNDKVMEAWGVIKAHMRYDEADISVGRLGKPDA